MRGGAAIVLGLVAALVAGCGDSGGRVASESTLPCGPKLQWVAITDYRAEPVASTEPGSSFAIHLQMASWDELALQSPRVHRRAWSEWLVPSAMACPPSLWLSEQTLIEFSITSDGSFAPGFPAGSELKSLFQGDFDTGMTLPSLAEFPAEGESAPIALRLTPTVTPAPGLHRLRLSLAMAQGERFELVVDTTSTP